MGWIDSLAASIVGDAEEAFVKELTERFASMLEQGVTNPDRLSLLSQVARQDALSVWARHKAEVTAATTSAFKEALSQQDEALCSSLAAAYGTSKNRTNAGNNAINEAARGMASIISRDNVALADGMTDRWYQVTADAVTRTQLGDSYRSVMEDAVSQLSSAGLTTIDYRSGVKTPIDAAVRRHVVSQASQCRADLLMRRCDEWGCDLVSVDAHWGARPSHAVWQGKVYSRSGRSTRYPSLVQATGYGTVTGLAGVNCRHVMTPWVEGYSKLPDDDFSSQEKLTGMTSDEYYEVTQKQRAMERKVRSLKRSVATGQDRGLDMTADRYRLGRAQANLRAHCDQYGLRRDYERERAYAVSQQPRGLSVMPKPWAEEAFIDGKGNGTGYAVTRRNVCGRSYYRKYKSLSVPKRASENLYQQSKRILRDRDGTDRERMSAVSWKSGKTVTDTFSDPLGRKGEVVPTDKEIEKIVSEPGGVILIHNHPGSSRPSWTDIKTASQPEVIASVVACHNGTVYQIDDVDSSVVEAYDGLYGMFWEQEHEKAIANGLNHVDEKIVEKNATDMLYMRNEEERWFRMTKL